MEIIGNWAYAGTEKFVSHALTQDGSKTLCGMVVSKLMARKGQQWEYEDSDAVGCLRCNSRPTQREADLWDSAPLPSLSTPEADTPAGHLSTPPTSG